jgi:hypothetical protein
MAVLVAVGTLWLFLFRSRTLLQEKPPDGRSTSNLRGLANRGDDTSISGTTAIAVKAVAMVAQTGLVASPVRLRLASLYVVREVQTALGVG